VGEVVGGGEIGPGGSATVDVMMRVAVSDSYALLLGDPADPTSVERVPLDIAGQVAALHASVAAFQP
jgi:hypothetical protein